MIQENKEFRTAPRQSTTFKMLQEVLEADEKEAALRFPGKLSPNTPKVNPPVAGVSKFHTCEKCGTSIVTQAVRITDDRFRHPECYTCTDCGLNLRMRGHFWVDDVMYCEKHANQRYQGPGSSPRSTVSPRQWVCRSSPASLWTQSAACLPEAPALPPQVIDLGMSVEVDCGQWLCQWILFSDHS